MAGRTNPTFLRVPGAQGQMPQVPGLVEDHPAEMTQGCNTGGTHPRAVDTGIPSSPPQQELARVPANPQVPQAVSRFFHPVTGMCTQKHRRHTQRAPGPMHGGHRLERATCEPLPRNPQPKK